MTGCGAWLIYDIGLIGDLTMVKATTTFNEIAVGLEALAQQVLSVVPDDRPFAEVWGWNMPQINRNDYASIIRSPIDRISKIKNMEIDPKDDALISKYPAMIEYLKSGVIPNLPGGNAFHVYITLGSFLDAINNVIDKYIGDSINFDELKNKSLFPVSLINDFKAARGQLESAKQGISGIDDQLKIIGRGAEVITNLDSELASLEVARNMFNSTSATLNEHMTATEVAKSQISQILEEMKEIRSEADGIYKAAQAAFSATTSVGLGKEFHDRAVELKESLKYLSIGLLVVLIGAAYMSYLRLTALHDLMNIKPVDLSLVWANVIAMVVSLGPPVWLAWLLTRQIGQRFRLSEDYGFKASIAKAYAGYREEAARLDDIEFQKKLFDSTIRKIEEDPLRYVERETESTPGQSILGRIRLKGSDLGPILAALSATAKNDVSK